MIATFLLSNWRVVLLGVLLSTNALTFGLWRHAANAYSDYRATVAAEGRAQTDRTASVITQQKQITEDTTNGWKAALDYLHAHPQRVLSPTNPGTMPGLSAAASGADETSGGAILTAERVAEDGAEAVLQLNKLQDWIEQQSRIK